MDAYAGLYRSVLFPFYETFWKRRNTVRYLKSLARTQWLPEEKIKAIQWERLQALLTHAYAHVPFYRGIFDQRGLTPRDIKTADDFQKLPLISKEDIRADKDNMIAENFKGRTFTKATGGSTGVPLELDYDTNSYQWRTAAAIRGYRWAGCEDGKRTAYIWGAPIGKESFPLRVKKAMHNFILQRKMFNSFKFTAEIMEDYRERINRFRPEAIVGYTTPLYNFAKFIKENKKRCVRIKSAITAAEKLYDYQREAIESAFGCKVFETYGSREFMLIAAECERHQGMHMSIDNLYIEILKEDGSPAGPGETGEIVITDLHNYGMPFIRYKIGDLGVPADRTCPCGRGLPLIEKIEGRILDTIQTPDGRLVPGEFFPHLMKEFKGIKQFQVIQDRPETLLIKIVKNGAFSEERLTFLRNEIEQALGPRTAVHIRFVEEIPLTESGKFRVTVSNLQDGNQL